MPIDASQVKWDIPAAASNGPSIDPASVAWDTSSAPPSGPVNSLVTNSVNTESSPGLTQQLTEGGKAIARQAGLTLRHGAEGVAQAAEVVTEPLRHLVTDPVMRAAGLPEGQPISKAVGLMGDSLGLPKPANETERVVGEAAKFMAGSAGMVGAAGRVAQAAAPGITQSAAQIMANNPGAQIAAGGGAGAGAGLAKENGGNEWMQLGAGLAGGLGVGGMVQAASSGIRSASRVIPIRTEKMEQQIQGALSKAGVDWQEVPEGIRQGLRAEAQRALQNGDSLDAAAVSRLLDFKRVGATPTGGMLTLDPVQITREQNLARMGANSGDTGLQGLAKVHNENNRALIESLNRLGAAQADDAFAAGNRAMGTLQRGLDNDKAGINALYSQARDSAGRSVSLDGHTFTSQASKLLDDNLLGGALPPSVQTHLNRIAIGEVPFDVNYAEQLKTAIGKLQRASNDGQQRMALGVVRQALDDTPILSSQPGQAASIGEQAMQAFDRARLANRGMMQRVEKIPGLRAVYEGKAAPDDFVQQFVISRSAKASDTGRLAAELNRVDAQAMEVVRGSIAQHLKTAAIGAASDETGKFSASGYNRALLALGQRKLAQFFSKDEIEQLRALGRVSQYTTVQPVGSAVNNSNSGALLAGRGVDLLNGLADKLPLMGIGPTVSGLTRNVQQRQALDIGRALSRKTSQEGAKRAPAVTFGALMAAEE
ncbi:hypothetical protein ACFIQF_12920 [Comamonas sp. J-3]|uniref:hypothetical protein n=1 Tax=Comamonas trifloxystrobinivorans TaxID=3350256 RepID=UPI0037280396